MLYLYLSYKLLTYSVVKIPASLDDFVVYRPSLIFQLNEYNYYNEASTMIHELRHCLLNDRASPKSG